MSKNKGLGKFLVGLGIGAGLGVLFAPKAGSETRSELKKYIEDFIDSLKEIDVNEVRDEFLNKIEDIRNELEDLDKEKVLKAAKKKAKEIQEKCESLVELAIEKGTPVLEDAANEVKEQTIKVIKEVLDKLENKEKTSKK